MKNRSKLVKNQSNNVKTKSNDVKTQSSISEKPDYYENYSFNQNN